MGKSAGPIDPCISDLCLGLEKFNKKREEVVDRWRIRKKGKGKINKINIIESKQVIK